MIEVFSPDKLNIAALGNIVMQLHIHVIARYNHDIAWPQPVFGFEQKPYDLDVRQDLINKLISVFNRI